MKCGSIDLSKFLHESDGNCHQLPESTTRNPLDYNNLEKD